LKDDMQLRLEGISILRSMVNCCSCCEKDVECHPKGVTNFESLSKCAKEQVKKKYERLREIQALLKIDADAYGQALT
jgi:hypothetical protein